MLNDNLNINARKHLRRKVLKEGKILSSNMNTVIDVQIRDLSFAGARIQIPASIDLPEEFSFWVTSEDKLYPAIARWRKGEVTGLEFIGRPRRGSLRKWK